MANDIVRPAPEAECSVAKKKNAPTWFDRDLMIAACVCAQRIGKLRVQSNWFEFEKVGALENKNCAMVCKAGRLNGLP